MAEIKLEQYSYNINGKLFLQESDFSYKELESLNKAYDKLSGEKNIISGSFTREEIEKVLIILLKDENNNALTHEDFITIKEGTQVIILANFFLQRAVLGNIIQKNLKN